MRAQVRLLEVQRADISGSSAVVRYQGGGAGTMICAVLWSGGRITQRPRSPRAELGRRCPGEDSRAGGE